MRLLAAAAPLITVWAASAGGLRSVRLDFESGTFAGWSTKKLGYPYSGRVVQEVVRRGAFAARFELRTGEFLNPGLDPEMKAELKEKYNAPLGRDVWYAFSTFIPEDFPLVEQNCVIAQWHGEHDDGEASRSPVLAHRYAAGMLYIDIRTSAEPLQQANDGLRKRLYEQAEFPKGVWHDFLYRVRWSHLADGRVEAWLDGRPIIDYRGPVGYNDAEGPYFKFGLYHHSGKRPFVIYHDEYRRGFGREDVRQGAP